MGPAANLRADAPEINSAKGRGRFTHVTDDGRVYTLLNIGHGLPTYGHGHWGGNVGRNRILKWNSDGELAWAVGKHAASSRPRPGRMHFPFRIYGTVKGCVAVGDAHATTGVWTEDGLWVGRLLENPVQTENDIPDEVFRLWGENFHGTIFQRPQTGQVIYFAAQTNRTHVFRITGWDAFSRRSGSLRVTERQADRPVYKKRHVHPTHEGQQRPLGDVGVPREPRGAPPPCEECKIVKQAEETESPDEAEHQSHASADGRYQHR